MKKYNKIDIAESQLETALDIYLNGGNLFSALTLAGAAEEIFGIYLKINGVPNSLEELVAATQKIYKIIQNGEHLPEKGIRDRANRARNNFKHLNSEEDLEIELDLEEETIDMLNRATTNYWRLKGDMTEKMVIFEKQKRHLTN